MFRRKRSSSHHHHPLSTSSTQSAQSAATHAFLKSQPSSNSLSSAAAAAALRSLTPTPISVENVQTKRTLQRQASVSSQLGRSFSNRPVNKNGLRRANSSGSMTTRTFREQSPGRPTSSYGTPGVAPPLPSIPSEYNARKTQNRRSISLGPHVWSSQSTKQYAEQEMDGDTGVSEPGSPLPAHHGPGALGKVSPEHQRSGSRNSINFSYPMNSRTNSPTIPSDHADRQEITIDVPRSEHISSLDASYDHPRPAQQPRKQSRHQSRGRPGPKSPGRSPRSVGTAVLAAQVAAVHRNNEPSVSPVASPVAPRVARQRDHAAYERTLSQSPASGDARMRSPQILAKRPSTVVEDRRAEETQETPEPEPVREQVDGVSVGKVSPGELPRTETPPVRERAQGLLQTPPVSPPESNVSTEPDQPPHIRQSSSPGRMTRFSTQLSVMNFPGEHLHQPPSRSLSPGKSVLKGPRKSSLSPDGRIHGILRPGPPLSEISDATSVASDDGPRSNIRRKHVKVSFDDEAEVVGVAASPPTSPEDIVPDSPPGKSKSKTGWFGFNRTKSSPLRSTEVDEFDAVMKPRPALPSFGSIRASRDTGAQPELIHDDQSDNESTASSEINADDPSWSFSNDHALGGIISRASQEEMQKRVQADNTPPVMHANIAGGEHNGESQKENIPIGEDDIKHVNSHKVLESSLPDVQLEQHHHVLTPNPNLAVPDITVQPATPEIEKGRLSLEVYDVPGEFPRTSVDLELAKDGRKKSYRSSYGDTQGDSTEYDVDRRESDDESSESIYSDAEEDLNGDGFGSINAILDRETTTPIPPAGSVEGSKTDPITKSETHRLDEDATMTDTPETCRIAQVVTPVPGAVSPPLPDSPDSSEGPWPFSSPYPPFPLVHKSKQKSPPREISRSSTMPVNFTKDSPLGEAHTTAEVRDASDRQGSRLNSDSAEARPAHVQRILSQDKQRPVSWEPSLHQRSARLGNNEVGVSLASRMPRRQLSNGSDSSSSFKRSTRPVRADRQHSMRRTLRGGQPSISGQSSPPRPGFASTESRAFSTGSGTGNMRTTLRGNASRHEKPSFFSAGRPPQKGRLVKAPANSFTSRFPDSDSDSDGGGLATRKLHRRKTNMTDQELRPVRGIPRRKGAHDGDSTELEDSSDSERHASPATRATARQSRHTTVARDPALAAVARSRGMTEAELEELLRRGQRKPGILHRFSIKKSKLPGEHGKFQSKENYQNSTIPEHSSQAQTHAQEATTPDATPKTGSYKVAIFGDSHKLLKKSSQKSSGGDTWPLSRDRANASIGSVPIPHPTQQLARPQTSDGTSVNGNKVTVDDNNFDNRNNSAQSPFSTNQFPMSGHGYSASEVVIESTGPKKRFQRLRKAFGLGR